MPVKNQELRGARYSSAATNILIAMRLPISAAKVFEGKSIDFNAMIRDGLDKNLFDRSIIVPFQYRSITVEIYLDTPVFDRLFNGLSVVDRSSDMVGKACGLLVAKMLGINVLPLSGRLPSPSDSKDSNAIERELR